MTQYKEQGGFRRLDVFLFGTLLQLETNRFCERFLSVSDAGSDWFVEPLTRLSRQARSELLEGWEGGSSPQEKQHLESAQRLIRELQGEYEMWLLTHGQAVWPKESEEARAVSEWRLDPKEEWTDALHDFGVYLLAQQRRFQQWTQGDDARAANALLLLCKRTVFLLTRLLTKPQENAGTGERVGERTNERSAAYLREVADARWERQKEYLDRMDEPEPHDSSPACPLCGKPMRKMVAKRGPNAGRPFWSCTDYPNCKGSRRV